jgi:prepilin-type N-terminal cleavage/methylation domain-containing protein/prepilin-type processing-associated H-X9-DG protein
MHQRRWHGFTLVEMLVVVAIVGVLTAMLLPAVQSVRESARRTQCANNLKQLGVALHTFESATGRIPGIGETTEAGWGVQFLPYIEQAALVNNYDSSVAWYADANQDVVTVAISLYACPSTPTQYRTKTGISIPSSNYSSTIDAPKSNAAMGDYYAIIGNLAGIGPAGDFRQIGALSRYNPSLTKKELDPLSLSAITDGLSSTIAFTELAGFPDHWILGRRQTDSPSRWGEMFGPWAARQYFWLGSFESDGATAAASVGPCTINCNNVWAGGTPYSFHKGGVNAGFADGSVRFLRQGMDGYVLIALSSRGCDEIVAEKDY